MHAPFTKPPDNNPAGEAWAAGALLLLLVSVLAWRWVGFQGHDDAYYAAAALQWRDHFPSLGADHWALRYPLVLPMAGALTLLGNKMVALALPNLAAYFAWLAFTYAAMRSWFGWPAAALATLAALLLPAFPVQATYPNPDLLETAFVLVAFWLHQRAVGDPDRILLLVACGCCAGLAFLTRETAIALVLYFGLLFLLRPGMARRHYVTIGMAFAITVGIEAGYFWAATGDPLYRTHLSATHDHIDRAAQAVSAAAAGHALDSEGVLAGNPFWQPITTLLISQKFGLLFVLLPTVWWAMRPDRLAASQRRVATDAVLLTLCSALFVSLASGALYVVPRYFTTAAGAAIIPLAATTAVLWRVHRVAAIVGTAVFAGTALLLLGLENTDPQFAERHLVALAAASQEPIHTDPYTEGQAAIPLRLAGLAGRVISTDPGPGALVAIPEGVAALCIGSRTCGFKDRMGPFTPGPNWTLLAREAPVPRLVGRLTRPLHLPADIQRKLEQPSAALMIYKVK
jgi:4-amino-4-deoxy-L-arabinose transferase-like glycosyltransferase